MPLFKKEKVKRKTTVSTTKITYVGSTSIPKAIIFFFGFGLMIALVTLACFLIGLTLTETAFTNAVGSTDIEISPTEDFFIVFKGFIFLFAFFVAWLGIQIFNECANFSTYWKRKHCSECSKIVKIVGENHDHCKNCHRREQEDDM